MRSKRVVDSSVYKNMPTLTMEQRRDVANRTAAYVFCGYHEVLAKEFGEEKAVEIGKKATSLYAPMLLEDISGLLGMKRVEDVLAAARVLACQEEQVLGCAATTLEASPERLVRSMSYCPLGEIVPRGVCTSMIEGFSMLLKNTPILQGYKANHESMYHDTGICRYVIEKEK